MNYPTSVTIGPVDFAVYYKEFLMDDDGATKLNGHIKYSDSVIRIDSNLSSDYTRLTLMHEIIHGCSTFADADITEKQTELLATWLTTVLAANPQLLEMFA